MLTAAERELIHRRIDEAARAGLGPIARPGHPSRFGWLRQAANTGREVTFPSLTVYDVMDIHRPKILSALNG